MSRLGRGTLVGLPAAPGAGAESPRCASSSPAPALRTEERQQGFTTKERDAESGLDYFGVRYYMAALGLWTSVDPVVDGFPSWNPYNYVLNNPVAVTDPDGRCPFCVGALIGAGLELVVQTVEVAAGVRTDLGLTEIGVAALAGGTGAGVAQLIGRASRIGTIARFVLNRATDAGVSAGAQLVSEGDVSATDVLFDVTVGAVIGDVAGARAGAAAQGSSEGKSLRRATDRAERIAAKNPRQAKQAGADKARARERNHIAVSEASAGAAGSNAASSTARAICTVGSKEKGC